MVKNYLLALLLLTLNISESIAQGTAGKEFWVTFMAQDWACYQNNNFNNRDTAELFISSQFAAKVTIKAPGQNFSTSVTLEPNVTKLIRLPKEVVCRYSDSVTNNGVNVIADTTINVYAVNRYYWSKGATVVIPVTSIVRSPEYLVTTMHDGYTWNWYCNGKYLQSPEFAIVGVADSSVIEIVPTGASSRSSSPNIPFQITLKKGQTFQYMTTDVDLTGSIIRSKYINSKFAVFAGNRQVFINRVQGSQTCWSHWDHVYEQMMPTVTWGNNYTAMPFKNNPRGYTLKIVAAENSTRILIDGSYYTTIDQGKFITYQVYGDTIRTITANNRISVAQFALGGYSGACQNHPTKQYLGDPSMLMLFPDEQFGQNATINTVSQTMWWWWNNNWWWQQNGPEHYINVMTRSSDTADFQINNTKLPNALWKTGSTLANYHFAQVKIDSGSHYLKSNRGFLAYVYGYNVLEGYAFSAAANFKPIQNNFVIINAQCKRDTINFLAITNDSFNRYQWKFGDNTTDTGSNVRHKYKDTGWYTVKMYCYHRRTNAKDSVTKTLYVADTKIKALFDKDTAICGPVNMVIISKGFNIDNEYRWNDGHPVYYRAVKNPGLLWLEVKERNGCVFRDTLNVSASGIPKASFTVSEDSFCLNRNIDVEFRNRSTAKDSIKNYIWDFGDTVIQTMDTLLTHRFKKSNMYPVILRAVTKYNCYHDTFMLVDVLPSPKAAFTFTRKDTCFRGNAIELKNNTVINTNDHRRYKWYFSEGYIISNSNPGGPRSYSDSGLFKVHLIYENKNGCIDTMVKTVIILPDPKAEFTYPNGTYCTFDTMPFQSKSYSALKPLTYEWVSGNSIISTAASVSHAFKNGGLNKLKLSVWSPGGCRDTIVRNIFVNETPLVSFTVNKDTQCFNGHSFDFINRTAFSGTLNYTWNISDGSNSSDSNLLNKTFAADSVYSVKLSTTSNAGCYAEAKRMVYLGGYPDVSFAVTNARQCFRDNAFNFINTSQIRKGQIVSYLWKFGNGDTSVLKTPGKYHYNSEDSFTVKLSGTSDLGCADTNQLMVVIHPQGKADFIVQTPVQCLNENNYTFTNTSVISEGSLSHRWNLGDNSLSDSLHVKHRYLSYGSRQVRLITVSDDNCRDTMIRTVIVEPSPLATFTINKDKQCFRDNLFTYTNTSTVGAGVISFNSWELGDNTFSNTRDIAAKQYQSEDSFNLRLVVSTDKACRDTAYARVFTYPQPDAQFKVNSDVQCFDQQDFRFSNLSSLKYGLLSYQWQFGNGGSSSDTNPSVTYSRDSVYTVRLISSSEKQCRDTAYKIMTLNVSPKAQFNIDKDRQCFRGNNFNFSNSSSVGKGFIRSNEWDMGDAGRFTTPAVTNYSYNSEDSFNVRLIVTTDKNCTDTLIRLAVTFAQPLVSFIIPNDSQCWQKHYFVIHNNTKLKYGELTNYWNFGDNTYSGEFTPKTKSYPNQSASYVIRYKAVSDHGCSDSGSKRVALLERPISDFSINDSVQCFRGHLFSFSNKTSFSAMNTLSYWWDYANGSKGTGYTPRDATYNAPGLYPMSLISYSSLTNCYDTIYKIIIPAPHADVSFNLNKDTQCLRFNSFIISNQSDLEFGSMQYLWHFGDGSSDTAANPVKTYSQEGNHKIKLLVNTNYNCLDSFELPVAFYPTPKASFTVNDSDQCLNRHSFDFINRSAIASGNYTQNWWFDDNSTGNTADYLGKKFILADIHTVRLTLISDNACTDTLIKTVYLENTGNSRIDFAENDSQCFRGNAFDFSNYKTNPKVNFTGSEWIFGDGQSSAAGNPGVMHYNKDGNFKVTLITLSETGCRDTVYSDVVIHPHPELAFTADKVCFPEPVNFVNSSTIKSGSIAGWLWRFGDNAVSYQASPLHKYASAGIYNVELYAYSAYGCRDTLLSPGAAIVQAKPTANFKFDQLPTIQKDQTRFRFTNLSSSNANSFVWDFGNQTGSTLKDPIALYQDTGRFDVTLIVVTDEGCSDTAVRNTGLIIPDFFYYLPNAFTPDGDVHNAVYKGIGSAYVYKFKLEIFNRWGEKVFETDDINQGWDGYYNGELCMEGAYLCRVQLVPFKGIMKTYEQMFMLMR